MTARLIDIGMGEQVESEFGARVAQSSKLRAKVDCYFRTIDDPDGDRILLEDLPVNSVEIARNPPGDADTATVSFVGDAFPFDLRIVADKSMHLSVWLYEQDYPDFKPGQKGHFFGVVDDVDRDRFALTGSLSCRDLTAVALGAMMPEGLVKQFSISAGMTIEALVEALLKQIPGTERWTVDSRTPTTQTSPLPLILPKDPKKGAQRLGSGKAKLSDIIPIEQITVWAAITNICARRGIVPEVMMGLDGNPTVVLVDGSDLQTGTVLRRFARGGKRWRTFVEGDGIFESRESLALSSADDRPDFVEVTSADRVGKHISARWPEASKTAAAPAKGKNVRGTLLHVPNVGSEAELLRLARAGYEALCHNQHRLHVTLVEPWSAGGGPGDADLLDLSYGAAVEIQTREVARGRSIADILGERGLSAKLAQKIERAQERIGALSLLFQTASVRHLWRAGSYRCELELRQFLGTAELPVFDSSVDRALLPSNFKAG